MSGKQYRMTVAGRYAFYIDDVLQYECDRVGIAFCKDSGGLLHQGKAEVIRPLFNKLCDAYIDLGMAEEVTYLEYIEGRFDLEDLNKLLEITNYAGQMFYKLSLQASPVATSKPSLA